MNLLVAYPEKLSDFCALIQENPDALRLCHKYDEAAARQVLESRKIYLYQCHCGLYEAIAPLYHFGVLSGYLMMGQTIDTRKINRNTVFDSALNYITDRERLLEAVTRAKISLQEYVPTCRSTICLQSISISSAKNFS